MTQPNKAGFFGLGLAPALLETLQRLNFTTPTPIQAKAIPIAIDGKDVIGIAQTGTGKTLAFGLPMIQRISVVRGQGLVLLPTRELAIQVEETFQKFARQHGLRTAIVIGGASMHMQIQALKNKPHVIIATPGRLNDHLQQGTANLHAVKILVLDEADRMLDMGFQPQIQRIVAKLSHERQTMLFSATMAPEIVNMAQRLMRLPVQIEVAPQGTAAEKVEHEVFMVAKDQKSALLQKLFQDYHGTILVFTRTKFAAKRLTKAARMWGHGAAELHSDRSLAQRREAMAGFKNGAYRVLIATDIAARGIDVTNIELVINYDLPTQPEDYVHRIGRTARAGRQGKAISFVQPDQKRELFDIERLLRTRIKVGKMPDVPLVRNLGMSQPGMGQDPDERPRSGRTFHSRNTPPRRGFQKRRF